MRNYMKKIFLALPLLLLSMSAHASPETRSNCQWLILELKPGISDTDFHKMTDVILPTTKQSVYSPPYLLMQFGSEQTGAETMEQIQSQYQNIVQSVKCDSTGVLQ
jgi:hypothetical protein